MDGAEELRRLRILVRDAAHDLSNSIGIALNYTDFLGEDVADGDLEHPIWTQLNPIQAALRRGADTVRQLRDAALSAQDDVGPDRAQDG